MGLFLDILFPSHMYCIACNAIIDETCEYELCAKCMDRMKWSDKKICKKCGKIMEDNAFRSYCADCMTSVRAFDRGYSCVRYDKYAKNVIRNLKYSRKGYIAYDIAQIVIDRINFQTAPVDLCSYDFVLPVPLHKKRLESRGFNQSELIGDLIVRYANENITGNNLKLAGDLMIRKKKTVKMSRLSAAKRIENVRDAFALAGGEERVRGHSFLIVDDVFTSGATVNACAELLKSAGAARVDVLTFASGIDNKSGLK